MDKKGQGALEFLTTYGWAFLVVLVLIGAMSQLGVFDRIGGSKCVSTQGFNCEGAQVNDANQKFKFKNTLGADVAIANASAKVKSTGEIVDCDVPVGTVNDGSSFEITCANSGLTAGKRENLDIQFNYYPATSSSAYSKPSFAEVSDYVESYDEFDQITTGGERDASSCGITFEAGKTYKLNTSISSTATCFVIDKAGVTLDCQDNSITGQGSGYGVDIQADNVVVRNCNISGFARGVYVGRYFKNAKIENNYFDQSSGSYTYNIYIDYYAVSPVILGNTIRGTDTGIRILYYVEDSVVQNNNIDLSLSGSGYGLQIEGPYGSTISGNTITLRSQSTQIGDAVYITGAQEVSFQNNVVHSYDRVACSVSTGSVSASVPGFTFTGNDCTAYNWFPGLWFSSSVKYSTFSNNDFRGLPGLGIQVGQDMTGTTFSNNYIKGNNFGALTFHGAGYYGTFTGNTIEGYDGVPAIFAYSTNANHDNTFTDNTLSAASGIFVISMNSQSYANSFVNNKITGSKWVTNGNVQNTFNDATRGNKYYLLNGDPASSVLNFVDDNSDGWADSGDDVPLSSTTASAYWSGSGSDSHPYMN